MENEVGNPESNSNPIHLCNRNFVYIARPDPPKYAPVCGNGFYSHSCFLYFLVWLTEGEG